MLKDEVRQKLQDLIGGASLEEQGDHCAAARNYLSSRFGPSRTDKKEFESRAIIKEEQAELLRSYASENGLWLLKLPADYAFLAKGGESTVYLSADTHHVIKVNDAVYYATWGEYFDNLMLHNLIFPGTAYKLLGFTDNDGELCAVLQQPYIIGSHVDLESVYEILDYNGFIHTRRQDYFHEEFGFLLEDMHDQNVISSEGILFFIDTVFYII